LNSKTIQIILFMVVTGLGSPVHAQEPFKLGYITDRSGPMRDSFAPTIDGFQLYIRALNDRGGIAGRPVEVIVKNDQLNPQTAASQAFELILSDKVNSIWGLSVSSTHPGVQEHAQRNKVPVIASFSGIRTVLPPAKPYAYSLGHVFEVAGEVSGKIAVDLLKGKGKVVCSSIDVPGGVAVCDYTEGASQAGGLTTDRVLFPPSTTDFSAIAQQIVGMKPTVLVAHMPASQGAALVRALGPAGFAGTIVVGAHGIGEGTLIAAMKSANFTGDTYLLSRYPQPNAEGKELGQLVAADAKYRKSREPLSGQHVMGWALGRFAEIALTRCGFPCSGEKLNGILESTTFDLGDLLGSPVKFSSNDHYGPTTWRLDKYNQAADKFQPSTGWIEASSSPSLRKK
jgi:branched-chain amino acid transport system substrate-binding protein